MAHKSGDDLKGSGSITLMTRNIEGGNPTGNTPNHMNNWTHNWRPVHSPCAMMSNGSGRMETSATT